MPVDREPPQTPRQTLDPAPRRTPAPPRGASGSDREGGEPHQICRPERNSGSEERQPTAHAGRPRRGRARRPTPTRHAADSSDEAFRIRSDCTGDQEWRRAVRAGRSDLPPREEDQSDERSERDHRQTSLRATSVVQAPVVIEVGEPGVLERRHAQLQLRRRLRPRKAATPPTRSKSPANHLNGGDRGGLAVRRNRIPDGLKPRRLIVELRVEASALVRLRSQIRTRERC
jgi:hypothetical protein